MPAEPDWLIQARAEGRILSERQIAARPPATPPTPRPTPAKPVRTDAPTRLVFEVDVPIRTASEANAGGKLRAKIARKVEVKTAVAEALPRLVEPIALPVVVTITRFGVRELDRDNLQRSLKAVRDCVAAYLGVDDANRGIRWKYRQKAAWTPFARIRIERRP